MKEKASFPKIVASPEPSMFDEPVRITLEGMVKEHIFKSDMFQSLKNALLRTNKQQISLKIRENFRTASCAQLKVY